MSVSYGVNASYQSIPIRAKQAIAKFEKFGVKTEEELRQKINSLKEPQFEQYQAKVGLRLGANRWQAENNLIEEFKRCKLDYDLIISRFKLNM